MPHEQTAAGTRESRKPARPNNTTPPGWSAALESYLGKLGPTALLDREQEGALARSIDAGYAAALEVALELGGDLSGVHALEEQLSRGDTTVSAVSDRMDDDLPAFLGELRALEAIDRRYESALDREAQTTRRALDRLLKERAGRVVALQLRRAVIEPIVASVWQQLERFEGAERGIRLACQLAGGRAPERIRSAHARGSRLRDVSPHALREADSLLREAQRTVREVETALRRRRTSIQRIGQRMRAARDAIDSSKRRLTHGNLRLVITFAKKYMHQGMPLADLVQEGNIGLMRAVDKFDHRVGTRFSTYASWWIRQAVQRAIIAQGRTIRLPVHVSAERALARRTQRRLANMWGREPNHEELARELGVSAERARRALTTSPPPMSLDASVGGLNSDLCLGDVVPDEHLEPADDTVYDVECREHLGRLFESLTEREQHIMRLRYGLDGHRAHTLSEIGRTIGLTRERIRQIESIAMRKLKRSASFHRLINRTRPQTSPTSEKRASAPRVLRPVGVQPAKQ